MQASEDFLQVVLEAHIIAAAENVMTDDMSLDDVAKEIVSKFIHLSPVDDNSDVDPEFKETDSVYVYANELLTLGLIWMNFYDAVKEGDGRRVLMLWKYLLLIFKHTGHRNYSKEAAILLIYHHFMASERVAAQLMTSRFVNTKGRVGCNISCDLHMEHLNRRLKKVVRNDCSNIQPSVIQKAAKSIGVVEEVCNAFQKEMRPNRDISDKHSKPSSTKDFNLIKKEITDKKVFDIIPKRRHMVYSAEKCILEKVCHEKVEDYILEKVIPFFM
jgi:L1 cell adhesion molecule like protein